MCASDVAQEHSLPSFLSLFGALGRLSWRNLQQISLFLSVSFLVLVCQYGKCVCAPIGTTLLITTASPPLLLPFVSC